MNCLRCGYCCIKPDIVIVDNPDKGLVEGNFIMKPAGVRCMHLIGDEVGEYSCVVHEAAWYKSSPCFVFTQIEETNSNCRIGAYQTDRYKNLSIIERG